MNVLVAGGTGFIGDALTRHLLGRGHRVSVLSRRPSAPDGTPSIFHWDPERGELDPRALAGVEGVVNLAGENLSGGRWTRERKRRLVESRVASTRFLARKMMERDPRPRAFVCASAVGIYGNRGEEILLEGSAPGTGFLAELCKAWEAEALAAREARIRTVTTRFGVVLDSRGGALAKLLPVFRAGIGGPLASGKQWMSWIALADVVQVLEAALTRENLEGPVNAVAPAPARNRELTRALGRVLKRPAILPVPAPVLHLIFGAMADEALLSSARAEPARLLELGYRFLYPELEVALRAAIRT
ncbi:MAG: TIGR01777 family protein [Candidatus Eisenbacteria bacterium]|uniref:TIGR01777 family protein n=1 Tax=Eiseniibacteriota bacterium TaxID=2212470 RepID=A0A538SDR9_UNCEI|nr:MAG: TIGR01777 family protein [Candidatus Eisenbacteria bacterium]TMQ59757.1 MAG: TIGR01777 family protein [Candidatus Eisenbacteria bacterium]